MSRTTFPAPVASLGIGKVWRRADVLAWAVATGRIHDVGDED